ncbi:MAG: hypothetical protein IMW99_03945 [Firmicutes bacterium]|nr:hypothetical protein [Bacillota bacterium]
MVLSAAPMMWFLVGAVAGILAGFLLGRWSGRWQGFRRGQAFAVLDLKRQFFQFDRCPVCGHQVPRTAEPSVRPELRPQAPFRPLQAFPSPADGGDLSSQSRAPVL